jgi:hypothetical protein
MLLSAHDFASSANWTPPPGMTEVVDRSSQAAPNSAGISLAMNILLQTGAGATGVKSAVAGNDADVGNALILALRRAP